MKLMINESDIRNSNNRDFIRYLVPSKKATEYLKTDNECSKYYKQLNRETV